MDQQQFIQILKSDPGDPKFIEYAESLIADEKSLEAIEVCLAGLSANPTAHEGRLLLAQIYFDRGYYPFAAQELRVINVALPENETVARLLEKLSPSSSTLSGAEDLDEVTVAESEFDLDDLESIGQDEES